MKPAVSAVLRRCPGLALVLPVALAASAVGRLVPVVGGPVAAVVLGVAVAAVRRPGPAHKPGLAWSSRFVLQAAVVLLGAQLSLRQVFTVGARSLPVMLGTLAVCLLLAYAVGRRLLRVPPRLATLIGVGTGVCGASAIAAVTPVVGAAGAEVAYAVSTIFVFNIAAVLTFPLLGHLLGMGQHAFGLFAGTAVNDTSSVVAAASVYGTAAANQAVVVKLTRTLTIIPISLALSARTRARAARATRAAHTDPGTPETRRTDTPLVPWFLVGFLVLAAAHTAGLLPSGVGHAAPGVAAFLVTVALAAIGLSTDLAALRRAGGRPLLLGAVLWVAVTVTSLGLQAATTGLG